MIDGFRALLCDLGTDIRAQVVSQRAKADLTTMTTVVATVTADVVYAIDKVSEDAVLDWFGRAWPHDEPVRIVMEGVEDDDVVIVPPGTDPSEVRWICIIDPIDGTRNLMHDKRAGWALVALAPVTDRAGGIPGARLTDIVAAAMTELPTVKQGWADQLSAIRGRGPDGVIGMRTDLRTGATTSIAVAPSGATEFEHGFASFAHYFPDGKALLATIEQDIWDQILPPGAGPRPVFEDQYLCSGGQVHEVATGRDRLVGDLRPLAAAHLGNDVVLAAHPYDVCTALVLTEAGGLFEDPWGAPVDAPLDTTTPVAFVAYANESLASLVRPALAAALRTHLGP